MLDIKVKFIPHKMLRRQKRSPEVVALEQLKSSLSRSIYHLNSEIETSEREKLVGKLTALPQAWLKGKNMDVLAAALLTITQGIALTPEDVDEYLGTLNRPEDISNFDQEVLAYIYFLIEIGESNASIAYFPNWKNTWTPIHLIE